MNIAWRTETGLVPTTGIPSVIFRPSAEMG